MFKGHVNCKSNMALKSLEERQRADELNFSMSFLQHPFPITQVHCVLLGLDFNSFSASVHRFQQFQGQTEFCKGRASEGTPCFWSHFSPEEQRQLKNLRRKNTKSPEGSNKILLQPWAKVHQSQRMSFLLISGGFWSGPGLILLLQSAQAHTRLPAGAAGHCQPHIWLEPVGAGSVHVFKAMPVLLPQNGSYSQKCVAWP